MRKYSVRTKTEVNGKILEQVFSFDYLGCEISCTVAVMLKINLIYLYIYVQWFVYPENTQLEKKLNWALQDNGFVQMELYGSKTWGLSMKDRRKTETSKHDNVL